MSPDRIPDDFGFDDFLAALDAIDAPTDEAHLGTDEVKDGATVFVPYAFLARARRVLGLAT